MYMCISTSIYMECCPGSSSNEGVVSSMQEWRAWRCVLMRSDVDGLSTGCAWIHTYGHGCIH